MKQIQTRFNQRPLFIVDLFCGAGGAASGYAKAAERLGFKPFIIGIDIEAQPNYPYMFIREDALTRLPEWLKTADFIHASPPCQMYSNSTAPYRKKEKQYSGITDIIRNELEEASIPSVIENVLQAPIRKDIQLSGNMFGLKVLRRRKFQLNNCFMMQPHNSEIRGTVLQGDYVSVYGKESASRLGKRLKGFEDKTILESWKFAMQMEWVDNVKELSQAIPPAYTDYIGSHIFESLFMDDIN